MSKHIRCTRGPTLAAINNLTATLAFGALASSQLARLRLQRLAEVSDKYAPWSEDFDADAFDSAVLTLAGVEYDGSADQRLALAVVSSNLAVLLAYWACIGDANADDTATRANALTMGLLAGHSRILYFGEHSGCTRALSILRGFAHRFTRSIRLAITCSLDSRTATALNNFIHE